MKVGGNVPARLNLRLRRFLCNGKCLRADGEHIEVCIQHEVDKVFLCTGVRVYNHVHLTELPHKLVIEDTETKYSVADIFSHEYRITVDFPVFEDHQATSRIFGSSFGSVENQWG